MALTANKSILFPMRYLLTGFCILCYSASLQAQLVNSGSAIIVSNGATVQVNNNLQNQAGSTLQSNGTISLTGTLNNNGAVKGNGTFSTPADITNLNGIVSPGNDNAGQMNVTGVYNNGVGTLAIEIGGPAAGTGYDRLAVAGAASISGTLNVNIINAYTPPPSTTFDIVTATGITGTFSTLNLPSGWTVNYLSDRVQVQSPAPLPVLFEYFNGYTAGTVNHLNWKVNGSGPGMFSIQLERSANGKDFLEIYKTVTGAGHTAPFNYEDREPDAGINYYRLSVTEADGRTSYSNIVALNSYNAALEAISLAPNPVTASVPAILRCTAAKQGTLKISITNTSGKRIIEQNLSLEAGPNTIQLRGLDHLPAGLYQAALQTDEGVVKMIRFTKQ